MKRPHSILIAASAIFLCAGAAAGWYANEAGLFDAPVPAGLGQVRVNLPQYKFINPPLFSESAKSANARFEAFESSVESYISSQTAAGSISSASIYFRDLNGGQWTGVNEDSLYTPSSMLKVVAMMAALKLAETDPAILSEKLRYIRPKDDSPYAFKAPDTMSEGYYSLQDLIGFMIRYSDNGAFDAIVSDPRINAEFVQVYSLFRLPAPGLTGSTTDFMSPKSFSSVFRALYNSSFFEWGLSEQILSLLSRTTFTQGLVSGIPANTPVAHKFGENTDELHDCGVVYYPGRPYLLCIMTRGMDREALESSIQHISGIAWDFVDKNGQPRNER